MTDELNQKILDQEILERSPAIGYLPYGNKLGRKFSARPITDLHWPLGCPSRLHGKQMKDLLPSDHIVTHPKTGLHFMPFRGTKAKISLVMQEPAIIHARHIKLLRYFYPRYFKVLTFHEHSLSLPNAIEHPFGSTWIKNSEIEKIEKIRSCSLIASTKKAFNGQKMRHEIVDLVKENEVDVEVMGRGYKPFDRKVEGLAPYRYSVIIENVREPNYFSEKLIDALLCETVPIYWGCSNIQKYFDVEGLIICETADDIKQAIKTMSEIDYEKRLPDILRLKKQAYKFANVEYRAAKAIYDSLNEAE